LVDSMFECGKSFEFRLVSELILLVSAPEADVHLVHSCALLSGAGGELGALFGEGRDVGATVARHRVANRGERRSFLAKAPQLLAQCIRMGGRPLVVDGEVVGAVAGERTCKQLA
jgi:hypothetical protein